MEVFKLLGTIAVDGSKADTAIDKTTSKAEKSSKKIGNAFKAVGTAVVAAFSVQKIAEFGKACVDASNVQIEAETKLETVMKQRMNATDAQIQKVKDLASAQQALGVVGDETQLAGAQQLATFLDTDAALESLIPAMNNLAVQQNGVNVTSENMVSIGNLMGKVMQGQTSALSRVGITFTEAQEEVLKFGTEEEKAATLAQVITDNVGNMNEVMAQTDEGKIQQAKNTFGDFQEMIGAKLTPVIANLYSKMNDVVTLLMKNFDPAMAEVQKVCEKTANTFKNIVGNIDGVMNSLFSDGFIESIQEWIPYLVDLVKIFASNAFDMFASKLGNIKEMFASFIPVIRPIVETWINGLLTKFEILCVYWNDVLIPVWSLAIDVFIRFATMIAQAVSPAVERIGASFQKLQQFVNAAIQNAVIPTIQLFIQMMQELWVENQDKVNKIGELFEVVFNKIASEVEKFVYIVQNYIYPFMLWLYQTVQQNMDLIKAQFQASFDVIGGIVDFFIALFKGDWQGMWDAVKQIVTGSVNVIKGMFNMMKAFIIAAASAILAKISPVFTSIGNVMKEKILAAKDAVLGIFENIKQGIADKMNAAKNTVSTMISKIKSLFNFTWSLPKLKLPHFTITPPGWTLADLMKGIKPELGVEWYKNGGILTQPTVFGMNGNNAMVGGEAGAEAVLPIDNLKNYIGEAMKQNQIDTEALYSTMYGAVSTALSNVGISIDASSIVDENAIVQTVINKAKIYKKSTGGSLIPV